MIDAGGGGERDFGKHERVPRAVPTPIDDVSGGEVWRFFDWFGTRAYCFSDFVFATPVDERAQRVTYRCGHRQRTLDAGGVLTAIPDRVLTVDEVSAVAPSGDTPMLMGLFAPASILSEDEHKRLASAATDVGLGGATWGKSLLALIESLERDGASSCLNEERIRGFMLRALANMRCDLTDQEPAACHRAVQRAKEYLHASFDHAFSLADVARETQLSKWHLTRVFQSEIGLTLGEYARHVRAHHALRRLRAGDTPLTVAHALGYTDQPHFTRELRRIFGFTPGQYARAHARRAPRPYRSRARTDCAAKSCVDDD
jgi:AraC-like DNA-binding protein